MSPTERFERRAYGCVSALVAMGALALLCIIVLDVALGMLGIHPSIALIVLVVVGALAMALFGEHESHSSRRRGRGGSPPLPPSRDPLDGRSRWQELEELDICWKKRLITEREYRAWRAVILGYPDSPPSKGR